MGVERDHMLGSKWQFIKLSRLGFSVSPDEVTLCKQLTLVNKKSVMQG